MNNIFKVVSLGTIFSASLLLGSCKKSFLDNKPTTQIAEEDVFKNTTVARAALNGIHATMYESASTDEFGFPSINLMSDLMSGDMGMMYRGSGWFESAYKYYDISPNNTGAYMWGFFYNIINNANNIITKIDGAKGAQADRDEIKGQALAYRAFSYFQLVNFYQFPYLGGTYMQADPSGATRFAGVVSDNNATLDKALGVPLYTAPTKEPNPRATLRETYAQITSDLDSALFYLNRSGNVRSDKSQIDVNVVHGLYARVGLYMRNWPMAIEHAKLARQGFNLATPSELVSGSNNAASGEWIWASEVNEESSGGYNSFIAQMDTTIYYAQGQVRAISVAFFDTIPGYKYLPMAPDDYRRAWGVKGVFTNGRAYARQTKFRAKSPGSFSCDIPLIRVAEMYLIEAEALAHSNQLGLASTVFTQYMVTRQPSYVAPGTIAALVSDIWKNKRIELYGEGQGFLEGKRRMTTFPNGVVSETSLSPGFGRYGYPGFTPVNAGSRSLVFRIPGGEFELNKGLIQN